MAEYGTVCAWNKCYIFANILQTPLRSWTWLYLQKANEMMFPAIYCPYGNNLNFSRIHFSSKIGLWNHWANGANARGPPRNTSMPWPTHSIPQTTAWSVHALQRNYATFLRPIGYNGSPQLHPKTASSTSTITTPSNTPSLDQPHSPPQTASGYNQPFATMHCGPTDRQTNRLTDGKGECSIVPYHERLRSESDVLIICVIVHITVQHSVCFACNKYKIHIKGRSNTSLQFISLFHFLSSLPPNSAAKWDTTIYRTSERVMDVDSGDICEMKWSE